PGPGEGRPPGEPLRSAAHGDLRPRVHPDREREMTKPILIVGGGPAGLAAAQALARIGQSAVLCEREHRRGGAPILSGYAKLVPSGEWAKDAIGGMVARAEASP